MPKKSRPKKVVSNKVMPKKFVPKNVLQSVLLENMDLVLPGFARYFFVAVVIGVILLFFYVISPFFNVLVYSALIAVVFYPVQSGLLKLLRGHKGISAFLSTIIVVIVFLAPFTLFTIFIAQEAVNTYAVLDAKIAETDFNAISSLADVPYVGQTMSSFVDKYGFDKFVQQADINVFQLVQDIGQSISTFIFNQGANLVKSLGDTLVGLFILLLTLFFFFRDGKEVSSFMKKMSPLPQHYEDEIENKLKDTTYAIVVGNFGTAILQGFAGGLGFAIAGVDNAIFWGTMMAFASLIPYIGASIIWGPVAIVLLFHQDFLWGGFLVIWGLLVVSAVDNFVRPYLIGSSTKMHPLATFLVVLGGIFVFGIKGIIFGPLILSLAVTVIHIYELEYKEMLKF